MTDDNHTAPRRPRGNPPGSKRVAEPRTRTLTQRYTEAEARLLESVAPGEVGGFIRETAVDRARQIVDQTGYDAVRDYIEDSEGVGG